jgi:hypothetical protein
VQALTASIADWASAHPIQARCELLEERLGYRLVQAEYSAPPPTIEWGLQVGECAHNIRSSLDNLAFALARLREDPPKRPNAIAFPIYREREKFEQNGRRNLDQLPPEAAKLIERIQPFQRDGGETEGAAEQDPLLYLQELNNTDKHRVPSVVLIAPENLGHEHEVEFRSEAEAALNAPPNVTAWSGPLSPGVVLFEMKTKHPLVKVKGRTEIKAVVAVEVLERPFPVERLLGDVGRYTSMVVEQFCGFFAPKTAA